MLSYSEFWEKLSAAYPISKGELRLPIATSLLKTEIDISEYIPQFQSILDDILANIVSESPVSILQKNSQSHIAPFLSGNYTGIIRFDCMINSLGELKVIELNSDYPDGLLMHDHTYKLLAGVQESMKNHDGYAQYFTQGESVFIAIPKESFFLDAYYTEYNFLKNLGIEVYIGSLEDLSVDEKKRVLYDGHKIDKVRRCIEVGKIDIHLLAKLEDTDITFINTLDLRILGFKDNLSKVKNRLVPTTVELTEDTLGVIQLKKDAWVIKPANLFEGKGVFIGKDCSQEQWERELRIHCGNVYVAQEYVNTSPISVDFYDDNTIVTRNVYYDICPHFFIINGKITGNGVTLVRYSENKILNVSQGGGIGYL